MRHWISLLRNMKFDWTFEHVTQIIQKQSPDYGMRLEQIRIAWFIETNNFFAAVKIVIIFYLTIPPTTSTALERSFSILSRAEIWLRSTTGLSNLCLLSVRIKSKETWLWGQNYLIVPQEEEKLPLCFFWKILSKSSINYSLNCNRFPFLRRFNEKYLK